MGTEGDPKSREAFSGEGRQVEGRGLVLGVMEVDFWYDGEDGEDFLDWEEVEAGGGGIADSDCDDGLIMKR